MTKKEVEQYNRETADAILNVEKLIDWQYHGFNNLTKMYVFVLTNGEMIEMNRKALLHLGKTK